MIVIGNICLSALDFNPPDYIAETFLTLPSLPVSFTDGGDIINSAFCSLKSALEEENKFLVTARKENKIWFLAHIVALATIAILSFKGPGYWLCAIVVSIILLTIADQTDPYYVQNTDSYWMKHTIKVLFVLAAIGFVISLLADCP